MKGLLFSEPMVHAIGDGTKTQTRRGNGLEGANAMPSLYTEKPKLVTIKGNLYAEFSHDDGGIERIGRYRCPWRVGEKLYVKETFWAYGRWMQRDSERKGRPEWHFEDHTKRAGFDYVYEAAISRPPDGDRTPTRGCVGWHRRPAIFMPETAARFFLEVKDIRCDRLQEISRQDAIAEGVDYKKCPSKQTKESMLAQMAAHKVGMAAPHISEIDYVGGFRLLWESIHEDLSWEDNHWVWAATFAVRDPA